MRELNECRAEVFRRSEKRIKARKRRNSVLAWCIPLCLLIGVWSMSSEPPSNDGNYDGAIEITSGSAGDSYGAAGNGPESMDGSTGAVGNGAFGTVDSFSFTLTWGCYGISSYDSETGKLVKTTDAANPGDYITTYQLTDTQKQQIYDLVKGLNVTAYPDTYDPHNDGLASSPSMTLILSVRTDTVNKTITAADIAFVFEAQNAKGQKFLDVCKAIADILMETEEWKALPEYEFFYD